MSRSYSAAKCSIEERIASYREKALVEDIGHIDNEYEWMLMGAKRKVSIPGKNVDEVGGNASSEVSDDWTRLPLLV